MGPFMVEIVFCRVTRRGRKKMSGMNKLARENMRNDGPMQSFIPQDDMLRVAAVWGTKFIQFLVVRIGWMI